jgi:hypothetical protein
MVLGNHVLESAHDATDCAALLQVRNNLLEPVIQVFMQNGPRYNLLNSAVLELVEFIRKENIRALISHLVEQFGAQLETCDYVTTFAALKLKYEQNQVRGLSSAAPLSCWVL